MILRAAETKTHPEEESRYPLNRVRFVVPQLLQQRGDRTRESNLAVGHCH